MPAVPCPRAAHAGMKAEAQSSGQPAGRQRLGGARARSPPPPGKTTSQLLSPGADWGAEQRVGQALGERPRVSPLYMQRLGEEHRAGGVNPHVTQGHGGVKTTIPTSQVETLRHGAMRPSPRSHLSSGWLT